MSELCAAGTILFVLLGAVGYWLEKHERAGALRIVGALMLLLLPFVIVSGLVVAAGSVGQ